MTDVEWIDRVRARLSAAIAREAPAGIGAWDRVWEIVDAPTRALELELAKLEDGEGRREYATDLGVELLAAWRRAGQEWLAQVNEAA